MKPSLAPEQQPSLLQALDLNFEGMYWVIVGILCFQALLLLLILVQVSPSRQPKRKISDPSANTSSVHTIEQK